MNYNPRKIALAFTTAAALALGMTACTTPSNSERVETPSYEAPDCDLDDLEEGDRDCNDPIAYAAAVKKYGAQKVAKAKAKHAEKVAKERARKAREDARKRVENVAPIPARPAPAPAAAPRTKSTKSSGSIFSGSRSNSGNKSGGSRLFGGSSKRR